MKARGLRIRAKARDALSIGRRRIRSRSTAPRRAHPSALLHDVRPSPQSADLRHAHPSVYFLGVRLGYSLREVLLNPCNADLRHAHPSANFLGVRLG